MRNFCGNKKVNEAVNKAWTKLFMGNEKWFDTEEEAENFLGDCAFDFLFDVLEELEIDCDGDENAAKTFLVVFSSYCEIEAATAEEAEQKFWDFTNEDKSLPQNIYDIEAVKEKTK